MLYSNVLKDTPNDDLPVSASFGELPRTNSIVLSRDQVRLNPIGATTFGSNPAGNPVAPSQYMRFQVMENQFADQESFFLTGNVRIQMYQADGSTAVPLSGTADFVPPDGVSHLFASVRETLNGKELTQGDRYNLIDSVVYRAACPQEYYNKQLAITEGRWLLNNDSKSVVYDAASAAAAQTAPIGAGTYSTVFAATNPPTAATTQALANGILANVGANAQGLIDNVAYRQAYKWNVAGGMPFCVKLDLSWLRTGYYVPPNVPYTIEITCANAGSVAGPTVIGNGKNGTNVTSYGYTLTNCQLVYNQLTLVEKYVEEYNKALSGKGIPFTTDCWYSKSIPVAAGNTTYSDIIQRTVSRARGIYIVQLPTGETAFPLDSFIRNNFSRLTFKINGKSYPSSNGVMGPAEAYNELMAAFDNLYDSNARNLISYEGWTQDISSEDLSLYADGHLMVPPSFILGINLQKTAARTSGLDFNQMGGYANYTIDTSAVSVACNMISLFHYDRAVLVKNNMVLISE